MLSSHGRLSAAHVERLLTDPSAQSADPLSRLMAAAAAPARPDELAGEDEAVRAFRLARRAYPLPPLPAAPQQHRRPRWAWALVVKVAAIVLATATASWALAATTGVLPAPWQEDSPVPPPTVTSHGPTLSHGPTSTPDVASPTVAASETPGGVPLGSIPPTELQNLRGLCQGFLSQGGDPEVLDNPGFERLVAAAGGQENVPAYCDTLLGRTPTASPTATAS